MTNNNTKIGQFAPQSKHPVTAELEKSAHLMGAIIGITAWFITMWFAAVGLGYAVEWTQLHCTWVPHFMIEVGHGTEYFVFAADVVCLLWSVAVHLFHHCKRELESLAEKDKTAMN